MPEEKDRLSFIDALSMIFEGYGARAAPSNTDPKYLRVVYEDTRIAVGFSLSRKAVCPADLKVFIGQALDSYYHLFVFASNQHYSADVLDYASKHHIILLEREDLENEMGKAYLKEIEIFHNPPILVNEGDDHEILVRRNINIPPPERKQELIRMLEAYREKNTPMDNTMNTPVDKNPPEDSRQIKSQHQEKVEEERPLEMDKPEGIIISPKVQLSKLVDINTRIGRVIASQMELIPFFLFGYSNKNLGEGGIIVKENSGLLAVNGITSEVEEWEPGFHTMDELHMDYIRLVPRVDRKVARQLAFNGVILLNTRVLEVMAETNGILRNGKKKTFPDPSSIKLNYEGLYYFPHWHIKGEEGSMFVDAVNGEVISVQKG